MPNENFFSFETPYNPHAQMKMIKFRKPGLLQMHQRTKYAISTTAGKLDEQTNTVDHSI